MEEKTKKPVLIFSTGDKNNFNNAVMFFNSLTKFHNDWDMVLFTDENDPEKLKLLPSRVVVEDVTPYLQQDPMFWYRQKPVLAELYMKDYELVIGADSDQLVLGDLSYIVNTKDYDVATVLNWNRVDPQMYGVVQGWGILPTEYMNCGLVAMRSEKFVHHWLVISMSEQFNRMQYKEQDLLNILCYYGNYNVRCLDHFDGPAKMNAWWGLINKGELGRTKLIKNADKFTQTIIVPKGEGDTPFPDRDVEIKIVHFAGGQNNPQKGNYRIIFPEEVVERIDYLVSPTK